MGFDLNPLHDIAEIGHDIKNDVLDPIGRDASHGLQLLNRPLGFVQHYYRYVHEEWTRRGVTHGVGALTGVVSDWDAWHRTENGETYRDLHGRAVNPGFDLANVVDHVVHGRDYMPQGYHLDQNGVMQRTQGGGIDTPTGVFNAVFDMTLDPTLIVGKVTRAVRGAGVLLGARRVSLSTDAVRRAEQLKRLGTYQLTADGKHALVGGRVLVAPRNVRLLHDFNGTRASNVPYLAHTNAGVRDAFTRLANMHAPEQIIESYPALTPLAGHLAKAKTVHEVSDVFEQALTVRNYGFLQHGLPTTSLTRRMAARAGLDLPTAAKVASNVADSNRIFRRFSSYRPFALDSKTLQLSGKVFDPEDPSFVKAFRDSLLIAHNRRVANAITGAYLDTPDLGTRINFVTNMMRDVLREAGLPDDHELMLKYGRDIDFLNRNLQRQVYGVDKHGNPISATDPATGEPVNLGLYSNQTGKIALPDFNELRTAVAEAKGGKSMTSWLVRGDDWLYHHYTTRIFKNLVLLSLGFAFRVAAGELVPAILQNDTKTALGSSLMAHAARLNPTLRDLSDEFGPEALVGKEARVRVPVKDEVGHKARTGRVISVDPEKQTVTVKHKDGETTHGFSEVTMLQREITDAHVMKMAESMGMQVTRDELPHIRAAIGAALHGVGRALVDEDYYNAAVRNVLSLDGHLVAPGLASNHDVPGTLAGPAEDLKHAYKQAHARLPKGNKVLGREFTLYDSGLDSHPVFWHYAIHEAAGDEGARLGAAAYREAVLAGETEEEATKAFVNADHEWMTTATSDEAERFRTSMALYGQDPRGYAALRAESMKGLVYGQKGAVNYDVLGGLAGTRELPTIADLAEKDLDLRPKVVKGRVLEDPDPVTGIEKLTQRGWRYAIHPIINNLSRAPIYTMLTAKEYKFLKPWVESGALKADEAHQIAQARAAHRMLPLIHNTKLRSQMSDIFRNITPFYFAQEQAYKRYGRVILKDPVAFRKALLGMHGIANSGIMRQDESGNQQIVMPGGGLFGLLAQSAASDLGFNVQTGIPSVVSGNTISLRTVVPEGNAPSVSPLFAISAEEIQRRFPSTEPFIRPVVGDINESESTLDQLIPNATLKRVLQATPLLDRETAFQSSYLNAIAYAKHRSDELRAQAAKAGSAAQAAKLNKQADEWFPSPTADPAVKQAALDRIRHSTRIQMLVKAAIGAVSPLSPALDVGDVKLREEVQADVKEHGVALGIQRFLDRHPNATAVTVFQSDNHATGVSLPATQAAYDWMQKNQSWVRSHNLAAAYLLPQTKQAFDLEAYNQEVAFGMRTKKLAGDGSADPGTFLSAVYSAATDNDYYASLTAYEDARTKLEGNPTAQQALDQRWVEYKAQLAAANPVWAASHDNPQKVQIAQTALVQLAGALRDPKTPESPQTALASDLVQSYEAYLQRETEIRGGIATGDTLTSLRDRFNEYLDKFVQDNPAGSALVTGIFRRLVNQ